MPFILVNIVQIFWVKIVLEYLETSFAARYSKFTGEVLKFYEMKTQSFFKLY